MNPKLSAAAKTAARLRPGSGVAATIKDAADKAANPPGSTVWGPPSPGQSWQDYENAVHLSDSRKKNQERVVPIRVNPGARVASTVANADPDGPDYFSQLNETLPLEPTPRQRATVEPAEGEARVEATVPLAPSFQETGDHVDDLRRLYSAEDPQYVRGTPGDQYRQGSLLNDPELEKYAEVYENEVFPKLGERKDRATGFELLMTPEPEFLREQVDYDDPIYSTMSQLDISARADIENGFDHPEPRFKRVAKRFMDQGKDDGTNDIENLTSQSLPGEQYLMYRENGIPGRPIDEIDPDGNYSKMAEYINYGFMPYARGPEDVTKLEREYALETPAKLFSELATSRESANDSTYYAYGKKFSGREFEKKAPLYLKRVDRLIDSKDPSVDPASGADRTGMSAYTPSSYKVTYADGTSEEFPGGGFEIIKPYSFDLDENGNPVVWDPTIVVEFRNGLSVTFDDMEDVKKSLVPQGIMRSDDPDRDDIMYWAPDLQLDDGTSIPFDEAIAIAEDDGKSNENIRYDFGNMGLGKPQRMLGDFWEDGRFNFEDLPAKMWDITASSLPYMHPFTAWTKAVSDAEAATHSIDPASLNLAGESFDVSEDMDLDKYLSAIGWNLAMPITEYGVGRIGGKAPFVKKGLQKILGNSAAVPVAEWLIGTGGEGLEEIPGNLFEDAARYGMQELYADPVLDEYGEVLRDSTGHEVRDESTPWQKRLQNFIDDVPEAVTGGVLLGGAFGVPEIPSTIGDAYRRHQQNKADKAEGLGVYREAYDGKQDFELPPELKARLDAQNERRRKEARSNGSEGQ